MELRLIENIIQNAAIQIIDSCELIDPSTITLNEYNELKQDIIIELNKAVKKIDDQIYYPCN